jgi:hypothetical protein
MFHIDGLDTEKGAFIVALRDHRAPAATEVLADRQFAATRHWLSWIRFHCG